MLTEINNDESGSLTPILKSKFVIPIIGIDKNNLVIRIYENEGQQLKRFVITSDAVKKLIGTQLKKTELHTIEQEIFNQVFKELSFGAVVLADVFDTKNTDKIQGTHTICIWQKSEDRYILIDPSSASFTSHLEGMLKEKFKKEINIFKHIGDKFYSRGIKQFGTGSNDARDCIDIAVKIAFKIIQEQKEINDRLIEQIQESINQSSDQNSSNDVCKVAAQTVFKMLQKQEKDNNGFSKQIESSINELSNQEAVNSFLSKGKVNATLNGTCMRELQSSDAKTRKRVLGLINKNKDALEYILVYTLAELEKLDSLYATAEFESKLKEFKSTILQLPGRKIPLWKWKYLDELQKNIDLLDKSIEDKIPELKYFPTLKVKVVAKQDLSMKENKDEVDQYNEFGYTILHLAVLNDTETEVQKVLDSYKSNLKLVEAVDIYGQTALHLAVATTGKQKVAETLIEAMGIESIVLVAKGNSNYTALHLAVINSNKDIVYFLINKLKKENPTLVSEFVAAIDVYGHTALHLAAKVSDQAIIQLLLDIMDPKDIGIKATNNRNYTVLQSAILGQNIDVIKILLLNKEVQKLINFVDSNGYSPLVLAAEFNQSETVRYLIESGANVNLYSDTGICQTPLMAACIDGHDDVVQVLLNLGADIDLCPDSAEKPIILAAQNYKFKTVKLLIEKGADPNEVNVYDGYIGRSLLHYAAEKGDLDMINFLLEKNADINLQDEMGYTPLMIADEHDKKEAIEFLLEKGANRQVEDNEGKNVIIFAIEDNVLYRAWLYLTDKNNQMYKNLTNNMNDQDEDGNTLLHLVAGYKDGSAIKTIFYLLFSSENIDKYNIRLEIFENLSNKTMLDIIHFRSLFQQTILTPASNIKQQNIEYNTSWDIAIRSGNLSYIKMFLAAGAEINKRAYDLANDLPYISAILRLYDTSDNNRGLEHRREALVHDFINVLFNAETDFNDKNNINYAYVYIISSIEAEVFTPNDIAQSIGNNIQYRQQLNTILAKRNNDSTSGIFNFLNNVKLAFNSDMDEDSKNSQGDNQGQSPNSLSGKKTRDDEEVRGKKAREESEKLKSQGGWSSIPQYSLAALSYYIALRMHKSEDLHGAAENIFDFGPGSI